MKPYPLDATKVYRSNGKKWVLPIAVRGEEGSVIFKRFFYEVLGYRKPKQGEWFLSGAEVTAYQTYQDLDDKYLVVKLKQQAVVCQMLIPKVEKND